MSDTTNNPQGLPPILPSLPERRARVIAARAELADFKRADHDHNERGSSIDYLGWAHRMSHFVDLLLPCVDVTETKPAVES